jgi:superfamily I DNA and/or RNA helicase
MLHPAFSLGMAGCCIIVTSIYRCHPYIAEIVNYLFYNEILEYGVPHEERVPDGAALTYFPDLSRPMVWMDHESNEMAMRTSFQSPGEASTVDLVVGNLTATIPPADVCVLAPNVAQVELIKDSIGDIYPLLSILTVDSAQGSTFEYAVISLVRSNTRCNVGFVSDTRRLNVMLPRARRIHCGVPSYGVGK